MLISQDSQPCLQMTSEVVQKFLRICHELFRRILGAGFEYCILDFLSAYLFESADSDYSNSIVMLYIYYTTNCNVN